MKSAKFNYLRSAFVLFFIFWEIDVFESGKVEFFKRKSGKVGEGEVGGDNGEQVF